jgi:Fe-S-cluster containining protein
MHSMVAPGLLGTQPAEGTAKLKLTSQSNKPAVQPMLQTPTIRKRRSDYPDTENLCEHCTAKCCHYFALPIDEPTERRDFDFIRWYLLHDRASVFVDDGVWYLLVHTTCKHLRSDYMCGIYETRPLICRAYKTDNCEFESDWCYEQYFETPEQIHEYTEAMLGPDPLITGNPEGCVRSRKPTGLPMV